MFEAIILAGGKGTRLKSVSGDLPKPMVEVNGIPFLYRLMRRLEEQGCIRLVLSLCYRADYIIERINEDKPVNCEVEFVVEEEPLGTGGAIKEASQYISGQRFLVLNGDTFSEVNFQSLLESYPDEELVLSGVYVDDVSRYGALELDENNTIISVNEKTRSGPGIINSGVYVISKSIFKNIDKERFSFEVEFIGSSGSLIKAFLSEGYFIDIGIPEDYEKACQEIR